MDSLCIIQDSKEDWNNQCLEMSEIYRNAQVNIAGPAAADCDAGFLHLRVKHQVSPISVDWLIGDDHGTVEVRLLATAPEDSARHKTEINSVLTSRAWILQERLLTQRMLFFGSRRMYFECNTNLFVEDCQIPVLENPFHEVELAKFSFASNFSPRDWLYTWYRIAEQYSQTEMTHLSDKFPALSGIAKEMAKVVHDEYIAGILKSDLVRGLCWRTRDWEAGGKKLQDLTYHVAPSWSWTSVRRQILFVMDEFAAPESLDGSPDVIEVSVQPKTSNIYGELVSAHIIMRGPTFKAKIHGRPHDFAPEIPNWEAFSREGHWGGYFPDNPITIKKMPGPKDADKYIEINVVDVELEFLYLGHYQANDAEDTDGDDNEFEDEDDGEEGAENVAAEDNDDNADNKSPKAVSALKHVEDIMHDTLDPDIVVGGPVEDLLSGVAIAIRKQSGSADIYQRVGCLNKYGLPRSKFFDRLKLTSVKTVRLV